MRLILGTRSEVTACLEEFFCNCTGEFFIDSAQPCKQYRNFVHVRDRCTTNAALGRVFNSNSMGPQACKRSN